ncbi:MAG: 30S ribosomal protein S17 [Candidatus Dojkabacteria bacterium]
MEKETKKRGNKREIVGIVTSNHMDKTVKVEVGSSERHPRYKKIVKRKKVFLARNNEELEIGDKVVIKETRPMSKRVRWVVINKK